MKKGDFVLAKRMEIENGTKFGLLTVIGKAEDYVSPAGNHSTQFRCRCECGNEVVTRGTYLKIGKSVSCASCGYKRNSQKRNDRNVVYCQNLLKDSNHSYKKT